MHGYEFFHGGAGKHFNFFQLPEDLVFNDCFKELSTDAKVLYCIMLKRVGLSYKHGWMDSAGRTYIIYTLEEAMRVFRCANQKATKLFNELEAVGLIEKTRQGQGKPDLVYVKDFATPVDSVDNSFQTHEESQVKTHENHDSGVMKSRIQDSWNSGASNRNNSLIRYSERDPILSGSDGMDQHRLYEDYFRDALEMDILYLDYPHDRETLDGILDLLVETCCLKRKEVRVAGDDKPVEVVKSRLMKLNSMHIQYVMSCLKENVSDVHNQVEFGKRIKEERNRLQMTQEDLAQELNIGYVHMNGIENGRKGCSIDLLLEIAEVLDVSTDYLLTGRLSGGTNTAKISLRKLRPD